VDFLSAVKAMKKGKKIRRLLHSQEWQEVHGLIVCVQNAMDNRFSIEEVEAIDWEIVKEKKTLSDKIFNRYEDMAGIGHTIRADDVKEALKEFIEAVHDSSMLNDYPRIIKIAKEIFGERLI
jgi:hypothetical protein